MQQSVIESCFPPVLARIFPCPRMSVRHTIQRSSLLAEWQLQHANGDGLGCHMDHLMISEGDHEIAGLVVVNRLR